MKDFVHYYEINGDYVFRILNFKNELYHKRKDIKIGLYTPLCKICLTG